MVTKKRSHPKTTLFLAVIICLLALAVLVPVVFAPLPSLSHSHSHRHRKVNARRSFEINDDMFWRDGKPFRIIGGDLHYFRILPQYWEDRLLRAKALGLNTVQTYVPWNLHEPQPGRLVFEGIADLVSFLQLCQKLDLLVMLRPGPYICAGSRYTTDGGSRETLEKGTIRGDTVFSAVDFATGDDPWPIFNLQKKFNAPGKSPPLSAEFYTGWLTHWGEKIAQTDAEFTASSLEKILSRNGSAVLYMAHGGTNFGFYNGANTGADESDYKPDLTSYDYDAPISESGDVDNAKFNALRRVIGVHSAASLPSVPPNNDKTGYGPIQLHKTTFLFDLLDTINPADVVESKNPVSMESAGQMFGFLVYVTRYAPKVDGSTLYIPEVHDRGQVFTLCPSDGSSGRPVYAGAIERWSNQKVLLPNSKCASNISLFVLVENMGRVNYGRYMFDRKGILSSVYLDGRILNGWRMISLPLHNLNEVPKINPIIQAVHSTLSTRTKLEDYPRSFSIEPAFYTGYFFIEKEDQVKDTFISFSGWGKGIAFVNDFNLGRYWPSFGPQCNLYVPSPVLRHGKNVLVILELESPHSELVIHSVSQPDFKCGSSRLNVHQL
ncbi:beta-galactosidase, putative [Ricinus communis]|uniref:beta-galactosidase n=1 Tax=Ricinus communis TaxID=3988 RepID=B9SN28_RICCO|nr:beta-galactosidase, putative [Ricinus communis]